MFGERIFHLFSISLLFSRYARDMAKGNYLAEAKRRFLEGTDFRAPIEAVEAGVRTDQEWCDVLAAVRAELNPREDRRIPVLDVAFEDSSEEIAS
jgi:hypothetical protein